jgi:enoyl-CoA hydratase/carnithine racemase
MSDVLRTTESGIARLVINRPDRRNALSLGTIEDLRHALKRCAEDREARVVAITGAGEKAFCAGIDLKDALQSAGGRGFPSGEFRQLLLDIRTCPVPTVALAKGHVMAGGLGVLLACDLALGCSDIHVSAPEIQVGVFPMMVMALLHRHVGRKRAAEMLLLGDRIPAQAARDYGILNEVFDRASFEQGAGRYLERIAAGSSAILRQGKEAILHVEDRLLAEELEYLQGMLDRVMETEDSREGMRAFVEKRAPRWQHR